MIPLNLPAGFSFLLLVVKVSSSQSPVLASPAGWLRPIATAYTHTNIEGNTQTGYSSNTSLYSYIKVNKGS